MAKRATNSAIIIKESLSWLEFAIVMVDSGLSFLCVATRLTNGNIMKRT